MLKYLTPKSIRPPFARYSHGVEVPAGKRLIVCSGQLGVGPNDSIPEDAGAQAELCFSNIAAVLAEAGLGLEDIVRINAFVTDRAHGGGISQCRRDQLCQSRKQRIQFVVPGQIHHRNYGDRYACHRPHRPCRD